MKVFEIVKQVLDQEYNDIDGEEKEKDEKILAAKSHLRKTYRNILNSDGPDFGNPVNRFAYIHTYTTSHANIVYDSITRSSDLSDVITKQNDVRVACIGGGPGSDFLGVLKYCINFEVNPDLTFYLLDGEEGWAESWDEVDKMTRSAIKTSTRSHTIDFTDPNTWEKKKKYRSADIFILSYVFSEMYSHKSSADKYFNHLFSSINKGSQILFIDFKDEKLISWFNGLCENNNISIVTRWSDDNYKMSRGEWKTDLGLYYEKFGEPKVRATLSVRVARKD